MASKSASRTKPTRGKHYRKMGRAFYYGEVGNLICTITGLASPPHAFIISAILTALFAIFGT